MGYAFFAPADRFLVERRSLVLWVAGLAGAASLAAMTQLHFDSNPLDLRSPNVESVSTLFDLMKNPQTSPNTIDAATPSLAEADALADRIGKGSLVDMTLTLSSFLPAEQKRKLAVIADAANLLDATLNPFEVAAPPTDAEVAQSFTATATKLRAAAKGEDKPASDARRLAAALEAVVKA